MPPVFVPTSAFPLSQTIVTTQEDKTISQVFWTTHTENDHEHRPHQPSAPARRPDPLSPALSPGGPGRLFTFRGFRVQRRLEHPPKHHHQGRHPMTSHRQPQKHIRVTLLARPNSKGIRSTCLRLNIAVPPLMDNRCSLFTPKKRLCQAIKPIQSTLHTVVARLTRVHEPAIGHVRSPCRSTASARRTRIAHKRPPLAHGPSRNRLARTRRVPLCLVPRARRHHSAPGQLPPTMSSPPHRTTLIHTSLPRA